MPILVSLSMRGVSGLLMSDSLSKQLERSIWAGLSYTSASGKTGAKLGYLQSSNEH